MRNNPELMKWFRQTRPLDLEDQKIFIKHDKHYNGEIIELNGKPIGVLAIKHSGELAVVLEEVNYIYLPELLNGKKAWGEMFIGNPILKYLLNAGFEVTGMGDNYNNRPTLMLVK
jgi:hypothetical protein